MKSEKHERSRGGFSCFSSFSFATWERNKGASFIALCLLSQVFLTACASTANVARDSVVPFSEGKIRIVPPVKLSECKDGYDGKLYNDGGTSMITIVDAEGKAFDVYFDRRIGKKKNPPTIYLYDYPDDPGSDCLIDQAGFRKKILSQIPNIDSVAQ
jgi:hypothetical protein